MSVFIFILDGSSGYYNGYNQHMIWCNQYTQHQHVFGGISRVITVRSIWFCLHDILVMLAVITAMDFMIRWVFSGIFIGHMSYL